MNPIWAFLRFIWRVINFIRNLVMNLVFLCFVLLLAVIVGLVANSGKSGKSILVGEQGALLLNLDGYLADERASSSWEEVLKELNNQHVPRQISTFDVVYAINSAENDERIQGLVLDLNFFEGGDLPALNYIGQAIADFKRSKKPVIAFADNYDQSQYFLASYADEIYLNPVGQVSLHGMKQENLYFKSLLDMLDVTTHVFRVGTYKSAVEPFLRDDMSAAAKADMKQWLDQMWSNYVAVVAENRQIKPTAVLPDAKTYVEQLRALKGDSTAYTQQRGLITEFADRFVLDQTLMDRFGQKASGELKAIFFDDYLAALPDRLVSNEKNKIAVVNVEGVIIDGESFDGEVGGDTIARLLRKAQEDDDVKAVVLRVNSPGGSAFASEIIRQEILHLREAGKPVIASMGGMAASGGYWIASAADYIVADKNTITGSIGIFAILPSFEKTIKKVGISADGVSTSPLSELSPFSPLSKELNDIFQLEIEHGYDKFISVVAQGRDLNPNEVEKVAQGKIWLGQEAIKHNLVDQLGDFDDAIDIAESAVNEQLGSENKIKSFGVEWMTDTDDSLWGQVMHDLKYTSQVLIQSHVAKIFALPPQYQQVKRQLGVLTHRNDPKGHYVYCLNCGTIK
ncbi:signal peptide peptidase SppA [Pasteurella sp. PK-2025]|uniref:signal peptide peptidase SppA n=1 Tax=unclassified Pasteurella TaxID=2621516 RepID=UPI003C750683